MDATAKKRLISDQIMASSKRSVIKERAPRREGGHWSVEK
jgi:hypothetical protein